MNTFLTILTIASTLLVVWITQYLTSKRWYADYFLKRKIEALSKLYATLVEYEYNISSFGKFPRGYKEFNEQVSYKAKDFLKAKAMASIYLDDEGEEILSELNRAFTQALIAVYLKIPKKENQSPDVLEEYFGEKEEYMSIDWDRLNNLYKSATAYLKNKLNPDILEQFHKPIRSFLLQLRKDYIDPIINKIIGKVNG